VIDIEKSSEIASAESAQDHVQFDRLQQFLHELAMFGGREDGGVSREALTDIDLQARRFLIDKARSLGCEVHIDDCANLFFRRRGHVDTQPVGGKLDGAYGVVGGLEVIAALNDAGIETQRAIEVVAWTNEEGCRFGPGAMGSSAFVDPRRLSEYRKSMDAKGMSFGDAVDLALKAVADVPSRPMAEQMSAVWSYISSKDRCWSVHGYRWG
jgi:N-carbamoyl-L-amino-acid hydrolase